MRRVAIIAVALLGACVAEPDYDGRPCGAGRACPDGFACNLGDICRRACSDLVPCPQSNQTCEGGLCVTPGTRDAGEDTMMMGECEGPNKLCTMPPPPVCEDDEYKTYASEGTCDTATNTCVYLESVRPCPGCEETCLGPCANLTCDDLQGGCRSNGRCEPNGAGGVECFYTIASNGTTCTKAGGGNGICTDGICGDCGTDTDCQGADLCVTGSQCVGGSCTMGTRTICESPPIACVEEIGMCNPLTGSCEYAPLVNGTACDDMNVCTTGETCINGVCSGGTSMNCADTNPCTDDVCDPAMGCQNPPNTAPCDDGDLCTYGDVCSGGTCGGTTVTCNSTDCITRSCNGTATCDQSFRPSGTACTADGNPCTNDRCNASGTCTHPILANGTACGAVPEDRCCSGTCVDISSDTNNCGGCGLSCAAGRACESVFLTTECPDRPANTTGRCVCNNANAECPGTQICRTFTPHNDRCAPVDAGSCAPGGVFVDVAACPNYCTY